MEEPDCERYNFRTKTPISFDLIRQIDAHYNGGLNAWKERHRPLVIRQRKEIEFFHIAVSQLFETAQRGYPGAIEILDKVIACTSKYQCHQILCPACRNKRQTETADKAVTSFANYANEDIRFMTLLIRVEQEADALPPLVGAFRHDFANRLRNNAKALGTDVHPFKMIGAFEVDLKNLATHWDASLDSRSLIEQLGYNPKLVRPQYLLHLHAIVGPLNDERKLLLTDLIERSLGASLLPYQLDLKSLHTNKFKEDNLRRLASYMFKARLQFADNIFDNNLMQKRAYYHTSYKGKVLVDYLNVVNEMQNFKGLKFDHNA